MGERWSVLLRFSHRDLAAAGVGPGSEEFEMPLYQERKLLFESNVQYETVEAALAAAVGDWSRNGHLSPNVLFNRQVSAAAKSLKACMLYMQPGSMLGASVGAEWQAGTGHC